MKKLLCMMLAGMMMFPAAAYAADGEILAKAEDGKYDVSYDGAEDRKEYLLWVLDGVHETAADASFAEEDVLYIDQKTAEDGKVEFNDFLPMKETDSTVVLTGEDMEPQVLGLLEAAEASDVIAEGTHGDNLTWVLTGDGTLTISGEGDMKESYSASYYPWYAYQTQITKIVVNEGVTSIGDYAFLSCDKLNSVTLPDALEIIGEYAFEYCGVLKSIYIPESVETIGEFAFAYCDKLNTVTLPKSLTVLNRAVFYGCDNLSSVVFPAGLKEIGKQAFASCNLSSIELPEGLTTIGERAFRDCANLIRVKFPSTLEVVGTEAFEMCASLKDFSLPEGLKTIGGCAFNDCGSITKLEIPASVTSIAVDAFANCDGLQSISVNALNTVYDSRNNCNALIETATDTLVKGLATTVIPDDIRVIGDFAFNGLAIKDIVLPDGLTEIGAEAFAWCDELTFPEIPATVTSIGSEAFRGCDALESIEIPGSVTQIGNYAFADCGGLKKVVIAEGVKDINDAAFNDCDDVRVVVLPKSMETIRIAAFEDCIRIKQVYYYGTAAEWEDILISSDNDPLLNANRNYVTAGAEELIYASGTCGDNVTWKINIDGVMTISGTGAMADYYSSDSEPWNDAEDMIKSIIVENGVTTIGAGAFYYYEELESVTLPASVKMIGTQAFRGCYNLKSVTMSEGLESIGQYAFISCNDLKSIDLPKSLREIGTGAFKYCYALERIAIPDGVTEIRPEVFQFCRELKEVALPKSIQSIDRYAFYGCDALTDVYYAGTTAQWDRISIGTNNDDLLNATLYIGGVQVSGIVSRVYGLSRCDTAMKAADVLKENLGVSKFSTVVVANAENFADALAGSYLAAEKDAPILLTNARSQASVQNYIKNNLKSNGRVYVLGGKLAVAESFDAGLSGFRVTRLFGTSRYDTNLAILNAAGVNSTDEILVCTGTNFADSLSVSSAGKPILLVGNSLTAAQKAFLEDTSGDFKIIGGPLAVNANIEAELDKMGDVERIYGTSRFDTSVEVAKAFFDNPEQMVLAYAQNFPDGLSGGPLAFSVDAPLVLTQNGKHAAAMTYAKDNGIRDGYVMGGTMLLSDDTVKAVFGMGKSESIIVK